ncbi:hypothetical protein [Mahella australiensis]|uniref:Phage major capsid protein E n=1 Tax=Mahella australiensis (strain DSM 15567 / CIP 107919 / 50-1 BON) TaxID=697281 RepID=F3ZVE2_MAHA5|nr:hypothetical protein [Mahella australiensis]AEE95292.1 hypothetical protein Mahau_0069 [Mahella australiensis 50-1 BON]
MRILDAKSVLEERRKQTITETLEYEYNGRRGTVEKKIVNGEMELMQLNKPIGEMLTSPEDVENILKKVTLDVNFGREQVPLLYTPLYRRLSNPRFPRLVPIAEFSQARAVFLEHLEGEEVKFGSRVMVTGDGVPIVVYAAGFDGYTIETEAFDETWRLDQFNQALGEAYNALLNHIHLSPIFTYTYAAKNKTAAVTDASLSYLEKLRATIRNGLKHAAQDKNKTTNAVRKPTVLLAHSANQVDLTDAMSRMVINGTEYPALGQITTMIFYDGWSVTVGDKTYTYDGVPADKVYLIDPSRYFIELIKQDLVVENGQPDITRLTRAPIAAYAMRGVYASPADAVEEVTLPTA